jgi:1-acyl-sn-glycerol-3-phosphate acyltransferase
MAGKTGAARIALETSVPVIPVATWGGHELIGAKKLHRPRLLPVKTLRVIAGKPVDLDDLRAQPVTPAMLRLATDRIMTAITALLAELRGEEPPPTRFDPRTVRRTAG